MSLSLPFLLPHLTLPFSLILLCPSPSSYSALHPHLTLPFSLILLSPSPSSYSVAVQLWLLFAKFALEKFSAFSEGMEFPRDIFEKAIIACGLHVSSVSHVTPLAGSIPCDLGAIVTRSYRVISIEFCASVTSMSCDMCV